MEKTEMQTNKPISQDEYYFEMGMQSLYKTLRRVEEKLDTLMHIVPRLANYAEENKNKIDKLVAEKEDTQFNKTHPGSKVQKDIVKELRTDISDDDFNDTSIPYREIKVEKN